MTMYKIITGKEAIIIDYFTYLAELINLETATN